MTPHVVRALAAMKADPSRRWTVGALARVGGLSRAAFARRFTRAVGTSPLRWLTEHRLELAEKRLLETDLSLAGIAGDIGYVSEFAFAKAFKRHFGVAPGLFRRSRPTAQLFRAAA
jgi:AraC-like DNA-binding protein